MPLAGLIGSAKDLARDPEHPDSLTGTLPDRSQFRAIYGSRASLIPREVVQTEDFGQFSPEKILSGQNYMDPRSQIGYPETIGGVLRNANQQFRSEPTNPRDPVSIFNLSTIPPDTMRPKFEIGSAY